MLHGVIPELSWTERNSTRSDQKRGLISREKYNFFHIIIPNPFRTAVEHSFLELLIHINTAHTMVQLHV
jgi:hypothetical protein